MLVGFVNVGLMTLVQATNVIMGANIGTTVTAHIVSLSGIGSIDIGAIAAVIGFIGIMMAMLINNEKIKNIGNILAGLGLIFVGLEFISTYAKLIMFIDGVPRTWVSLIFQGDHFPLLLIVIGILLTALVHSSSTITSLMVVLASIGVLSFPNALFLALGSNIGTCITSIMSSVGTNVNAKRTALAHLFFNLLGCLIFVAPLWIWQSQITNLFASMSNDVGQQIAIFHTLFNICTTIVLLPFTKYIVNLMCLIVKDKELSDEDGAKFKYIDDRLFSSPAVAAGNIKKEIIRMSEFSISNIKTSVEMLLNSSVDKEKEIRKNEEIINKLNKNITAYLTKLIGKDLTGEDEKKIGSYYHVVSDVERVGDYAENILEYVLKLREEEVEISGDAKSEIDKLCKMVEDLYDASIRAFDERNTELLTAVDEIEDQVDDFSHELENKHIERVKAGTCVAELGSVYLQTVSNLERVGDHITNLAFSIMHYRHVDGKVKK